MTNNKNDLLLSCKGIGIYSTGYGYNKGNRLLGFHKWEAQEKLELLVDLKEGLVHFIINNEPAFQNAVVYDQTHQKSSEVGFYVVCFWRGKVELHMKYLGALKK